MADLIDRAALLSELEERSENHKKRSRRNVGAGFVEYHKEWAAMATGIEECLAVVKNNPAVDAVALPCKLGEKLYSVDGKTAEVEEFLVDKHGISMMVSFECDYNCDECAFNTWRQEYCGEYSCDGEWGEMTIPATEIGKNLFRTYEEAKEELWKRRANDATD